MALQMETIRATADRIAASHHLDLVELEFTGGSKHRTLRVYLEKDSETRERAAAAARQQAADQAAADQAAVDQAAADQAAAGAASADQSAAPDPVALPPGVPVESLSLVTHEDCAHFARDFGTVLDVEDLIPGAEYTLEVSSPGLERKLLRPADYTRFTGFLVKLQTFTAVDGNRHFTGRLTAFDGQNLTLDLAAVKQKGKAKKAATEQTATLALANVEKANLVAEI